MAITEMVRSLGKNVFLALVALCMVGVFSFVSFAEEATTNKPAAENPAAGTDDSGPAGKIEHVGQATAEGIEQAAKATGRGIERAGEATSRGLNRAANATERELRRAGKATGKGIKKGGEGIQKGGEAVEKTFSSTDSAQEQP
jgi:hypothetical protein